MKIILTSSGINEAIKKAMADMLAEIKIPKLAFIYTIRDPNDEQWLRECLEEFELLKVDYEKINISENRDFSKKNYFDIYYVAGGNTFYILDRLKKTNLFSTIQKAVADGKIYIGTSAGSIIAGPDIEIAGYGPSGDENDLNLKDLQGLNLVPFNIYPHLIKSEEKVVRNYYKLTQKSVIALADGQAVIVSEKGHKLIGFKKNSREIAYFH